MTPTAILTAPVTAEIKTRELSATPKLSLETAVFQKLFEGYPGGFNLLLWDNSLFQWGSNPAFTLIFKSKKVFKNLFLKRNSYTTGEDFINGGIDIKGDIFEAINLGYFLTQQKFTLGEKLQILFNILFL